jgi:hypothetical protein
VFFLQGSFQGHQGHFSAGAVWRLCSAIFGDSKARLANFDLLNLMAEVSEPFEAIFTSKFSIED